MVATGVGILGGIIALFWRQSLSIRSAVQHFPAGAAIAANVVPEVERMGTFAGIPGRFIAGGPAMIGLKWVGVTFEHGKKKGNAFHWAWLPRLPVDTLLDGAITSTGF